MTTFHVIDKTTGKEYSTKDIVTEGLVEDSLYQMFLGEDGELVMTDSYGNMALQDPDQFEIVINKNIKEGDDD